MKFRYITTFLFVILFFFGVSNNASAATKVNLFQITSDSSQQTNPLVYQNTVAYTNYGGSKGINVYGYNLKTKQNFPIVANTGQQFITDLYNNLVIYDSLDPNAQYYTVRMYNTQTQKDTLIASGSASQNGGITNGEDVVYINGYGCGQLNDFNLLKKTTTILAPKACTPLRMSDNTVVYSDGTNAYGYNLDRKHQFTIASVANTLSQVPNIDVDSDIVVWMSSTNNTTSIMMKNLNTGKVKVIATSTTDALNYPAVSDSYIVWSDSSKPNIGGVNGYNMVTGQEFVIEPQGSQQNSNTIPAIWNNTAVWMSYRTGNGDIYGATLSQ